MVAVTDLVIGTHEVNARVTSEYRCIAVIPFAVKVNKIPVVSVACYGVSPDHHVGDACLVEEHFRAAVIDIAVAVTSGESSVCGACVRLGSVNRLVIDVVVYPVKDISRCCDIAAAPKA